MSDQSNHAAHYSTQPPFLMRKDFLHQHVLPSVRNQTVLEIGCFDGYISTATAEHNPLSLILLEPAEFVLQQAAARLSGTNHLAICGDMHRDLYKVGKVDVALLLGVIYHSPAPLHVLEQLVNHCDPSHVFIDNPANAFECVQETSNVPGDRHVIGTYRSCGMVTHITDDILATAMQNLGYCLKWIKQYPQHSMYQHAPIFYFVKDLHE